MTGIIALINFLSAFIQAASGFGYGIFAMFLMPLFLPFRQCSVISAAVIVVIAVQMTVSLRRHITVRKIIIPMAVCLPFAAAGIWIIEVAPEELLQKVMGVFLLFLSAFFYYTEKRKSRKKRGVAAGLLVGMLTGLTTGMFNIVGPFLTLYYYGNCKDNLEFKGNLECSFLIAGLFSLGMNLYTVQLTPFVIGTAAVSGAAAVLAGLLGLKVFRKLRREELRKIILVVLPLMGLVQILK